MTALESEGKALFFDKTRTNCSNCHQSSEANSAKETFTNYRYFNIGVPSNQELIKHNKLAADFVDNGLLDNPMVKGDEKQKGKFKVPTLRNIGVTAPYMHNGVFRDLKTVLLLKTVSIILIAKLILKQGKRGRKPNMLKPLILMF